jgi:predicted nucleotidyltransferase
MRQATARDMLAAVTLEPLVPPHLLALASRLVEVPGIVAAVLGGSRAIGCHRPDSDVDLGLYYRGRLDVEALRGLAAELADRVFDVFEPGGWGPWVDGGAWLEVAGVRVDWIYRDLDRVTQVWSECRAGRYEIGIQAGHPLGFYSHAYPGEVALCRILADPTGELAALRAATQRYPDALAEALVAATWEPDLVLYGAASHGVAAVEPWYAAGCLFRAIGVLGHALHGHHRVWITSEKRLIDSAGRLRDAPAEFPRRAQAILAGIGATSHEIAAAVDAARALVADTIARLPARPALALPQ